MMVVALAMACGAAAAQQKPQPSGTGTVPSGSLSPNGKFRVFGLDATRNPKEPDASAAPIPVELIERMQQAWDVHERYFGAPRIDTMLDGKPVVFVVRRRPADYSTTVAVAENLVPDRAANPVCATAGTTDWCKVDKYSFHYNLNHAGNFMGSGFTAHELTHVFHNRVFKPADGRLPHWVAEGASNGWGFAMMERFDRKLTRRALARRFATQPKVEGQDGLERQFGFILGLRHYDQPLAIDHIQDAPWRHPDYPSATGTGKVTIDRSSGPAFINSTKKHGHLVGTGYMTGSLFRHMFKGRPGGAHAVRLMHSQSTRPPTDARDMRDVIRWLDEGLKLATVADPIGGAPRKVWRRGLRDVFSEMIVELADLPDLVVGSRAGRLEQALFDQRLWAQGCRTVDLGTNVAATVQLRIAPIAARCIRVKFAADAAPPDWVTMRNSPYAATPVPYLPENFIITVEDGEKGDTCRDIDVGTRGQMLSLGASRPLAQGGCAVSWSSPYAPLEPTRAGGTRGYQTIVITNVADRAEDTRERVVTVRLVRPSVSATVSGTATPQNRGGDKPRPKKPLPNAKRPQQPAITSSSVVVYDPPEPGSGCDAEKRAVFECGDGFGFGLNVGDSAEAARAITASLASSGLVYLPAEITRGSGVDGKAEVADTFHRILEPRGLPVSATTGSMMAPGGGASGMKISVSMPDLEPGQTGTFPARVEVNWHSDMDAGIVNSIDAAATELSNGCLHVVRRKTNAQMNITQNTPGFILGSLSARLFEDEQDAELACRQPIRSVGTIEIAFASPGVARSDLEPVSFARAEIRGEIDRDIVAQQLLPMDERSDFDADELEWASSRSGGAANGAGATIGAVSCQVRLTDQDRQAFAETVAAGYDAQDAPPEIRRQLIGQIRAMADGPLRAHLCAWAAAGRPRTYSLPDDGA
ncbi:hypothetical protein [Sphingomonas sp.]|uniref:hypothetical protein n=1 Tax=Sphingomonas sp. TaxID=28214 RepID=UPI002DD69B5F|nr:hypothetical protein [Sphingomonas sp.]